MAKTTENQELPLKPFEIKNASIKELSCNYGYEIMTGKNKGDVIPNRKGAHLIHEDLRDAFNNLDVFLAHIDGAFSKFANNQTPLSELEAAEELSTYWVGSFKIVGVEENRSVILSGSKTTIHGTISFETPKIKLSGTYIYVEELTQRIEQTISEVEAYMDGKCAPDYTEPFIEFPEEEEESEDEFENAKVAG